MTGAGEFKYQASCLPPEPLLGPSYLAITYQTHDFVPYLIINGLKAKQELHP